MKYFIAMVIIKIRNWAYKTYYGEPECTEAPYSDGTMISWWNHIGKYTFNR